MGGAYPIPRQRAGHLWTDRDILRSRMPMGGLARSVARVHATAVSIEGSGVLLRGPSGSGKSDLALRLIDAGASLVADDQTELCLVGQTVEIAAPAEILGKLEVRGLGIVEVQSTASAPLALVIELIQSEQIERLPEAKFAAVMGLRFPLLGLAPFEASAVARIRLAVRMLTRKNAAMLSATCLV